ncbi:UDP-N-acetylglucosamine--N-acetylmuramyl-(pentapeptide) pyrophosphoryl-undecaprenol N-acetylglucosamine transferase MurG [Caulifigura coniformis]|uniref:UDP-N-acetylglucosamine--N-acetylmuramyl-(pentapeptide) pyrophosphoryl-undecaprenol N-acetylglucosamine transferase n=1 Tax=Caulifigura coniformis TaxID=2527983 RepID=A0A517SJQ6_9PLAN|nr:UDP-N-acetylglucosamine--N-acetylmuramyl-(pentapeptide) pyrophosphoryl-undecaprenol N-acetylglucosamine transferase [Caulifigura coniformis]QDT56336.1 UDP-N-acetylglucosamine--N-acetylmuramyl-(pentapeptide) pyrophosphoryl-undecaprenol N-acetylglucosamine transferase MurG [Caulifigura coniformis]
MTHTGPHILIATGGSGGHLYPAFAVADEIERRWSGAQVRFTIGPRDIERDICRSENREAQVLPLVSTSEARRHPVRFLTGYWRARRVARELLRSFQPTCVIGAGGFTMGPVVQASLAAHIPVVLLEQNVIPGRATRWFSRRADTICSSFEVLTPPLSQARVVVTGNPVRAAIAGIAKHPELGRQNLLVMGGSQGARGLNEGLVWLAEDHPAALASWNVVHQTGGDESAREVSSAYARMTITARVMPFISDMAGEYTRADLVIARAGATSLAELACAGIPAVLVPYPFARDLHQHTNARVFSERGAALVVEQGADPATTGERLLAALESLGSDARRIAMSEQMKRLARPDAAARVVDVIAAAIERRGLHREF